MQSASRQLAPLDFTARMRLVCDDMVGSAAGTGACRYDARGGLPSPGPQASVARAVSPRSRRCGSRRRRNRPCDAAGPYRNSATCATRAAGKCSTSCSFYLPRFMNLDFREKLITVLHELWHISPDFNGDIRRHAGRYHAHTHSQAEYDAEMGVLADRWLRSRPPDELWELPTARLRRAVQPSRTHCRRANSATAAGAG